MYPPHNVVVIVVVLRCRAPGSSPCVSVLRSSSEQAGPEPRTLSTTKEEEEEEEEKEDGEAKEGKGEGEEEQEQDKSTMSRVRSSKERKDPGANSRLLPRHNHLGDSPLSELSLEGDTHDLAQALSDTLRAVTTLASMAVVWGPPLSHAAVRVLYGAAWADSAAPGLLAWFCWYMCLLAVNGTCEVTKKHYPPRYDAWRGWCLLSYCLAVVDSSSSLARRRSSTRRPAAKACGPPTCFLFCPPLPMSHSALF